MKAYLIARVSTEEQRDALPAQVHRLLDYANRNHLDYELIEFQESAYKGTREAFNAVIARIQEAKQPIAVVFDKIDRYTRDSSADEVRVLQKLYRAGQIELHFPSDNLIINQHSPATDIMRLGLGVVLAQYYSDAISDNVKRRIEQKLRDGEWIGKAPVGYKNVALESGKKWVEVDPADAEIVRRAFSLYATGSYSLLIIKRKLTDEFNIKIGTSQLDLILKNPFYYGQMRVKGALYPHNYETIISQELYDHAEAVRQGYKVKPTRYAGLPFSYRGLIHCADCGCRVTFERKKGRYIYGHCTQWKGRHGAKYLAEGEFTKQLMNVFESIYMPDEAVTYVSEKLQAESRQELQNRTENLTRIDTEIAKYKKRMERVYEDYIDDVIPKELYERKYNEFQDAVRNLEGKRKNIELGKVRDFTSVNAILKFANKAPELFKAANFERKRELINSVISNLQLDGDLLRWKLKKPFETMAFCSDNSSWLRRLDSNQRPGD